MSHFEVRKYDGVLRHLRIMQVSHLFLARQNHRLAEKEIPRADPRAERVVVVGLKSGKWRKCEAGRWKGRRSKPKS